MAWTLTDDLGDYVGAAGEFLRSRPVRHTLQLSVIETLRMRGRAAFGEIAPLFGWWRSGAGAGAVQSAFLHTPHPAGSPAGGYAGAATAAVSRAALQAGVQHVVLFTDLANPTSNALYQRLGYRPVQDRVVLSFAG